jgi:hypothetical protein
MKASEFRKLIREEVRRVVKEDKARELVDYFKEAGIPLTSQFNLKKMSAEVGVEEDTLLVLLQNLEDEEVMRDISKGDYTSFDEYDSDQFNDSYDDMVDDLNLSSTTNNARTSNPSSTSNTSPSAPTDLMAIHIGQPDLSDIASLNNLSIPNTAKSLLPKPKTSNSGEVLRYYTNLQQVLVDIGKKIVPGIKWAFTVNGVFHLRLPNKPTPQIQAKLKSAYNGAKSVEFRSK